MTKHELLKYAVSKGIIDLSAAEEIRRIVGKTDKEIAEIYGISRGSVWQIRKGITYARA